MGVVEIDAIGLQPAEGVFEPLLDGLRGEAGELRQVAHLRGDDHGVAVAARGHPVADDGLGLAALVARDPVRVGIGGIDEISAGRCVGVKHLEGRGLIGCPAEHIAAEAQRMDDEVGAAELNHGPIVSHRVKGSIAGRCWT